MQTQVGIFCADRFVFGAYREGVLTDVFGVGVPVFEAADAVIGEPYLPDIAIPLQLALARKEKPPLMSWMAFSRAAGGLRRK